MPLTDDTLKEVINTLRINTKDVLTQEEAAVYTGLSMNYLYQLTYKREIPHYKQGKRNIFKRKELDEWMTSVKVHTNEENAQRVKMYEKKRKDNPKY